MRQAALDPGRLPLMSVDPTAQNASQRELLQSEFFGRFPEVMTSQVSQTRVIPIANLNNATMTEQTFEVSYGNAPRDFRMVTLLPKNNPNASVILSQNFCPLHAVFENDAISKPAMNGFDCDTDGVVGSIFGYFFGRYIRTPPLQEIIDRGYGFAAIYPPDFLADSAARAQADLRTLFPDDTDAMRPAALGVWASLNVLAAQQLKADGATKVVAYGHSRYGKTALLSAIMSQEIDGVIAHQSGTGGASLMRDALGESVEDVMRDYPHWFGEGFAKYMDTPQSLPIDADAILREIAPRPILLGNARRDVWSDPNGAFNAARYASQAWKQKGLAGLSAKRLDDFRPQDDISFWIRPGTHGVTKEDWPAFLAFMDAHFK